MISYFHIDSIAKMLTARLKSYKFKKSFDIIKNGEIIKNIYVSRNNVKRNMIIGAKDWG